MSAAYVVDPSVALAWLLPDEASPLADAFRRAIERGGTDAWIPGHWWLEVTNGLLMAERRKRITAAEVTQALALINALPLEEDAHTAEHASAATLALARKHGLTIYDAAYLELAQRLGAVLVSSDAALLKAAKKEGTDTMQA